MFQFKTYQREDLSRAALHNGAILAWDPGLGKTIAMFAWPILKAARRVLIVAPASLHQQIIKEGADKFKTIVQPITDQDHFYELAAAGKLTHRLDSTHPISPSPDLPIPEYYITDYRWLGYNKADEWHNHANADEEDATPADKASAKYTESITNPLHCLRLNTCKKLGIQFNAELFKNIGIENHGITCLHMPTLATLLRDAFDCVVCDEAVRLKSGISHNANGVLKLNPTYRLALTGTPIKNKLHDIFFLATWIAGNHAEPTARWPYSNTSAARHEFANAHLIMEENHTRAIKTERRQIKATNQICNLHRLWKLLAPIVVRRRKEDIGADLVKKNIIPIEIQAGTDQQATYQYHISHPPEHATPLATIGAQLSELRQAACSPDSPSLRSRSTMHTPKMHAILNIIADLMEQREQVVVFSPFQQFSASLSQLLKESGVKHALLDGNTAPTKRGALAAKFKAKEFAVLLAGMDSMGEGHSFDQCSNLILPSVTWAYDTNAQAIERVHRLTSPKDVNIYCFITKNTVDEKLAAIFSEKGNSSDLALDGKLSTKHTTEVTVADLLSSAIDSFDATAATIDESSLIKAWSGTAARLIAAQEKFKTIIPTATTTTQPQATNQKSKIKNHQSSIQPQPFTHYIAQGKQLIHQLTTATNEQADALLDKLNALITACENDGHSCHDLQAAIYEQPASVPVLPAPEPAPVTYAASIPSLPAPAPAASTLSARFPLLKKFVTA